MPLVAPAVDRHSAASAKIALFRSLFRGREDVYPRRFESRKTGKSGYAPACANEWVRGHLREAAHQVCRVPQSPVPSGHRRRHPLASVGARRRGSAVRRWRLSAAAGRDLLLPRRRLRQGRLAGRCRRPSSTAAAAWAFQPPSNGRAPDEARTSGSSSRRPFPPPWPAGWVPTSSPRRWRVGRTSAWIRTTVCSRVRTRCRKADSET